MSERSRDLVLRSLQLFDEPGLVEELVHPSWINHEAMPENRYGRDGARGSVRTMNDALADLRFEPHHVVADGDLVALHVTVTGRHVGSFAGVPATGRRFRTRHVHLYRVEDGCSPSTGRCATT